MTHTTKKDYILKLYVKSYIKIIYITL